MMATCQLDHAFTWQWHIQTVSIRRCDLANEGKLWPIVDVVSVLWRFIKHMFAPQYITFLFEKKKQPGHGKSDSVCENTFHMSNLCPLVGLYWRDIRKWIENFQHCQCLIYIGTIVSTPKARTDSLVPDDLNEIWVSNFETKLDDWEHRYLLWKYPQMNIAGPYLW